MSEYPGTVCPTKGKLCISLIDSEARGYCVNNHDVGKAFCHILSRDWCLELVVDIL